MQVVWNRRAEYHLNQILLYGVETFGKEIANRLFHQISKSVKLLSANPYLGKKEPFIEGLSITYRSLLVHKHYKLIYHIEAETIYIAALFDVRKLPSSLVEEIGGR